MRHGAVDQTTGQPVRLEQGAALPANCKYQFMPRIKCHDCPGKLYTAGPEQTVVNFEVHLKNRGHRAKVDERRRKT